MHNLPPSETRVSDGLKELLQDRMETVIIPKIIYKITLLPPQDELTLRESDAGVVIIPEHRQAADHSRHHPAQSHHHVANVSIF